MQKKKQTRKLVSMIMTLAMIFTSVFSSGMPAYAAEAAWNPATETPVLVVTGNGVVTDSAISASDLTSGIAKEKSYTQSELEALETTQALYSTINTSNTKSIYLGKGITLEKLFENTNYTQDKYNNFNVSVVGDKDYTVTFDKNYTGDSTTSTPLKTPSFGAPRYYYPNIATATTGGMAVVKTMLAWEQGGTKGSTNEPTTTAAISSKLLLIPGQQSVTEQSNPLYNRNVYKIVVGDELPSILTIGSKSYKRAELLMMPRYKGSYTYSKSGGGSNTDYVAGVPLLSLLTGYNDADTVQFISADGFQNSTATIADIKSAANQYLLAYESGATADGITGIYNTAKNNASIHGYLTIYASGKSPMKMITEIKVTPASGTDYTNSPFKHITNGGDSSKTTPYNIDAITGATLTVEGPGVAASAPLSIRQIESENGGLFRGAYTDYRGINNDVPTTCTYEGIRLKYVLNNMTSGAIGVSLTSDAEKVQIKNRARSTIAEFTLAQINAAEAAGKPIIIAYGTSNGTATVPFVYDGGAGSNPALGNEDGCIKLVYDKSVITSEAAINANYKKFSNMAYIYADEAATPGYKHDKAPYNLAENSWYPVTITGDKLGREINYKVSDLEAMVPYDPVTGAPTSGGIGFRAEYSLANSNYWYVYEYEGVKLWSLLQKAGIPAGYATDANKDTQVSFAATDGYQDFDKFTLEQISNPNLFGYYEKNPADNNDGKYTGAAIDLKNSGYPVLVAYGVNKYPYVISNSLDGYLSGLSNDGGPVRIISGKLNYNHANGSKQAKYLEKIVVGNDVHYSTHSGNPDARYQALSGQAITIKVVGTDGTTVLKNQVYTIKELEDMIYGSSVSNQERLKAKVKDYFGLYKSSAVYTDLYEGVSLDYLIKEKVQVPGTKGTITFKSADAANNPDVVMNLETVFNTGSNQDSGKTGLKPLIAFAKNGSPMVASSSSDGYVKQFLDGLDSSKTINVKNDGGPLALLLPQTDAQLAAKQSTSLKNINEIVINLQADKYAHIDAPYNALTASALTVSGAGTKLIAPVSFTVNDLEGKQTLVSTADYSIRNNAGTTQQVRFRGLNLYDFLKSIDVGLRVNASEVVVTCADNTSFTFPMADIIKKDYVNSVTSTGGLSVMLAYGASSATNSVIEDGKPLVRTNLDSGYDAAYFNSGGPLKLVVGQKSADDINSTKILKDVVGITVSASAMTSWKHDVSPTYSQYLDTTSYKLRVLNQSNQVLLDKTYTLRQLEAMDSLIVRDEFTWLGTHENEGLDLWDFIQQEASGILGINNPITVTATATDGFSKELVSIFGLDGLKNGIQDGSARKSIILAYADNGYPLVPTSSSEGFASGNDFGPIRLITQNNQGACLKNVGTISVVVGNTAAAADFTLTGSALTQTKGYNLSEIQNLTQSAISYSWYNKNITGSAIDAAKGVLLKDLLDANGLSNSRYTVTLKTSDDFSTSSYTDITMGAITAQQYLLAYEVSGSAVSALDNGQKFRIYRNYNAGLTSDDSWYNRCTKISGIEVKDSISNQTVFSLSTEGVAARGFKLSELKAMTTTSASYQVKANTVSAKGVLLSDLINSIGITDNNTKINIKTTDNFQDKPASDSAATYWNITLQDAKAQKYLIAYEAGGAPVADMDKMSNTAYVRLYRNYTTDTALWVNELKSVNSVDVIPVYTFKSYKGTGNTGDLPLAGVRNITVDASGGTWAGTYGGGAAYKAAGATTWTVYTTSNSALQSDYVVDVAVDKNGGVWFTQSGSYSAGPDSNKGVAYAANPANMNSMVFYNTTTTVNGQPVLPNNYVQQVEVDASGNVWLGSFGGLTRYTPSTNTWKTWTKADGLPAASVDNFTLDKKGGVWVGFYPDGNANLPYNFSGGYAYISSTGTVKAYLPEASEKVSPDSLADFWVRDIAVDKNNGAWVVRSGSYSYLENVGGRVDYIDSNGNVTHYTGKQLLKDSENHDLLTNNSEIRSVAIDGNGDLWFGAWNGLYDLPAVGQTATRYSSMTYDWPNVSSLNNIYAITITADGKVMAGSNGGMAERTFNTAKEEQPPEKPQLNYILTVDGNGVNSTNQFTFDQLKSMTSGKVSNRSYDWLNNFGTKGATSFTGVKLSYLLNYVGIKSGAKAVDVIASDGYHRSFNLGSGELGVDKAYLGDLYMLLAWDSNGTLQLVVPQENSQSINKPLWVSNVARLTVLTNEVTPGGGSPGNYVKPGETALPEVVVEASADGTVTVKLDKEANANSPLKMSGKGNNPTVVFDVATTKQLMDAGVTFFGTMKAITKDEAVKSLPEEKKEEIKAVIGDRPIVSFEIKVDNKPVTSFNGKVKVSVPYTLGPTEDKNSLVIYYIDNSGKLNMITDCTYDEATKSIVFKTNHFSVYAVGYNKVSFTDTQSNWAKDYISYLASRNILNGMSESVFAPDQNITRAQFTKILACMANIDVTKYSQSKFSDVQGYYSPFVQWANEAGIVNGVGNDKFAPNKNITREQIALMIDRYVDYSKFTLSQSSAKVSFTDNSKISTIAYDAVNGLVKANIISGVQESGGIAFKPQESAKRSEVAKMLSVLLKQMVGK